MEQNKDIDVLIERLGKLVWHERITETSRSFIAKYKSFTFRLFRHKLVMGKSYDMLSPITLRDASLANLYDNVQIMYEKNRRLEEENSNRHALVCMYAVLGD